MNPPVITCSGVTKNFGKTEVLKGIDLAIPHGSIVGLLGTNGAGKSTLIKCLLGLLKISSGAATVCCEDPWDLSAETKNQLGYVLSPTLFGTGSPRLIGTKSQDR